MQIEVISHFIEYQGKPARMVIANDITIRKKTEDEILLMNDQLRQLAAHLQTIREEERLNISRELHDEIGQHLTGIKMDVEWLFKRISGLSDVQAKEKLNEVIALVNETVSSVRRINSELRPSVLDELGLHEAISWKASQIKKNIGIIVCCTFHCEEPRLSPQEQISIFRIVQESLNNVSKHSGATECRIDTEKKEGRYIISIRDNGKGFIVREMNQMNGFGLLGMKERAIMINGQLLINSSRGKGTTVELSVPSPSAEPKDSFF